MNSHDTFVLGINENHEIIFLKGYDYSTQKDEAQSDLKYVQDNFKSWYITGMDRWTLVDGEETLSFKIKRNK